MDKIKIALIGMPGCGKSTLGEILKGKMNIKLIDLDDYIVEAEKKSIDELFSIGENIFREAESKALEKVLEKEEDIIISTGGGIIKIDKNVKNLKNKSIVVFIDREIEDIFSDIDAESRPLLKNNKKALIDLYDERYNLYKKTCHIHIKNKGNIDNIAEEIISKIVDYKGL